jgi:hypothetical protein
MLQHSPYYTLCIADFEMLIYRTVVLYHRTSYRLFTARNILICIDFTYKIITKYTFITINTR